MDTNSSGFLIASVLQTHFGAANVTKSFAEVQKLIENLAGDGRTTMSFTDFLLTQLNTSMEESFLYYAFKRLDLVRFRQDNDDFLEADDIEALLASHGVAAAPDEVHMMIFEYDLNHDYKLDYEEFRAMVELSQEPKAVVT